MYAAGQLLLVDEEAESAQLVVAHAHRQARGLRCGAVAEVLQLVHDRRDGGLRHARHLRQAALLVRGVLGQVHRRGGDARPAAVVRGVLECLLRAPAVAVLRAHEGRARAQELQR